MGVGQVSSIKQAALRAAVLLVLVLVCSRAPGDPIVLPTGGDQSPVPISLGKGSYASVPPPDTGEAIQKVLQKPLYILDPGTRPIPTNKWWTNLIVHQWSGRLWAFPEMVEANQTGINFYYPTRYNDEGRDPVSEDPLNISGVDFHPTETRAKDWDDWTVSFRIDESDTKYVDVTLGRGMPYAWFEYTGLLPVLQSSSDAQYFDEAGRPITFPYSGSTLGMTFAGRSYGVFAPSGSMFFRDQNKIGCQFGPAGRFLVVCALPRADLLSTFASYAYAIPRGSRMTWTYDPEKGVVRTHWQIATEPLQGTETRTIQGWLPHHTRDTTTNLSFTDFTYLTPRGTMKCAIGNDFEIDYPFNGFLPFLPAPKKLGLPHDFDETRMRTYLEQYAARTKYGDDTYWGGKSLTQFADYMAAAHEMHDTDAFTALRSDLHTALTDWYTYTPGKTAHYFAYYPGWHALIGIKPSYGSEAFNDNHFHYGYFTRASALLGFFDPDFLKGYGHMAKMVAKEYANWDRTDTRFPFLRTFDIWEGHSWAGGFSSPTGNNQESSSEAVQSWGGLFLLGEAMGDKDMIAAGAMGYAMETRAALEYWFNIHGDNFSPNYKWPIAGMVWSGGQLFGTYFSGDPDWAYAIQWLPMSPMMDYLARDPDYTRASFQTMMQLQAQKKGSNSLSDMGTGLGNVVLSLVQLVNPDWVSEQLDDLWDAGSPIAHDVDTPGITYYLTHSDRMLGDIRWDYHMSLPMSRVYLNKRTGVTSYVVFNPGSAKQAVNVYQGDTKVGTLTAPPGLTLATKLERK
ncbi:MAG: glycosyl hydrolase [Capsulimonadaceae bacterium]